MGGAVAGATAALPFAPALGPFAPIAPLAGAIMGGTGGEAWQQIAEQAYDWFTGGHTAPRSGTEAARGIREAIVPSGLGEVGGQTLGNIVTKVLGYIGRSRMTPAGRQLLETGKEAGFTPAVADLTQGKLVRPLEALSEKQVGGGRLTQAAEREIEAMRGVPAQAKEGWLQQEARRVAGPQADASRVARGETIQKGLEDIASAHRVGEAVEWEFPRAQETGVPDFRIDNLRERMRSRVADQGDLQQAITPSTSARLSSEGGRITPEGAFVTEQMTQSGMTASSIVKGLAQGEGPITLRQAMTLRKTLGEMYQAGDKAPLAAFRQDMKADADFNPARAKAWEDARKYTRENIVPFRSDEPLGRLIDKQEPVAVVQELMLPKDQRINLLRAVEKQTGRQGPTWEAIQAEGIIQAIEKPTILKTMGPETRKTLFTPEQEAFLGKLQNWVETSTASLKESKGLYRRTGTNIVAYDQIRHGVTLVLGAAVGGTGTYTGSWKTMATGAAILMAPNVVARMLRNPTTA